MTNNSSQEESIFEEALKRASDVERLAFLDEACRDNPALRARLDLLLEGYFKAEGFLVREPQLHALVADEAIGSFIGRYKLLEKIGEGGFGAVYMAEQSEPVKRRIALKIIKLGMDTKQVVARFEAERQALALMDHPNIAKVFDGGATETGRPYFVMELVRGVPITKYCQENGLAIGERLKLFALVCQAVQHAHQKGIIHRDLKPSNILVTVNDGVAVPKVIDFGVAKATKQELTEKTIFTQFHHFIGTPAYMSPEQAEMTSVDIDTRSDIYSLGVLLYELLTGKPPFDGKELLASGLDAMRRTIREKEPLRPSTRLARERSSAKSEIRSPKSEIDQDLDWIVMKCLEKDRARRYDTANSLVSDIERHLNDEAIVARPPSAGYRLRKFVRRHKLQFAAVAVLAVVLVVASAISAWQAIEARRERELAKQQARLAKEQAEIAQTVKTFLTAGVLGLNPYESPSAGDIRPETTRVIVDQVARRLEKQFTNQPLIEAEIRAALRDGYERIVDHSNVVFHGRRVLELYERLHGPLHSNTLEAVGWLAHGLAETGHRAEGEKLFTNTIALIRENPQTHSPAAAGVLKGMAGFLRLEGRHAKALRFYQEALAMLRETVEPGNPVVIETMGRIADVTGRMGQVNDAERLWREVIDYATQHFGPNHPRTTQPQFALARLQLEQKRWSNAAPILENVLAIQRPILGTNHVLNLDVEYWLGQVHEQKGDTPAATRLYLDLYPRWQTYLAQYESAKFCCSGIASFFVHHRRYEDARSVYRDLKNAYAIQPPDRQLDFDRLIVATAAVDGWPAAAEICRKHFDQFTDDLSVWRTKATVLLYAGDTNQYRQTVTNVLASASAAKSRKDRTDILNVALLGPTQFSPQQVSQCKALIQSLEHDSNTVTAQQENAAIRAIGGILFRLGQLTNGLEHLNLAAQKYPSGLNRARVLLLKTLCLHRLDRIDEAQAAFDEAEAILQSNLLKQLNESESFLTQDERTCLILCREARALLDSSKAAAVQ